MKRLLYILVGLSFAPVAQAAVLKEPLAIYSSTRAEPMASDVLKFNEQNKMAAGAVFSGATGLVGAHLQFFPGPDFAFGIGYGGGESLKAFNFYYREMITYDAFSFYWTLGYARWWNTGDGPITSSTPDYLAKRFLSPSEKASGTFVEHIIYPGIGAEFYNFTGDLAGTSIYLEALLMTDLDGLRINPGFGLGTIYHF
jgi:hypothetical protein